MQRPRPVPAGGFGVPDPERGEVWLADLNPTRGREQAGMRPVLVISHDVFNAGPADLVVVLPITSTYRGIPTHVPVQPPEGGLHAESYILTEAVRSISKSRLVRRWGKTGRRTLDQVADRLRILMDL